MGGGRGHSGWGAELSPACFIPRAISMASGVQLKEEQLVALYAYQLAEVTGKWSVRMRQRMAEGQLVRYCVLPITTVRGGGIAWTMCGS